ncbi:hypothetical protein ACQ86G_12530 [Roseateles chitinivorans]|uniref:hypothetical protein n=1 Tax=Roseateles chitinivorans TaxID=2917965 RepID=UPI003D66546D
MTDTAAGQVSAGKVLGIGGDAVIAVENARTLVAAIKSVSNNGGQAGVSFTPARSALLPMSLSTYAKNDAFGYLARAWGNTTFSYAQGSSKVSNVDMSRRAVSIESSLILDRDFDPLIAVHKSCTWSPPITAPGQIGDTAAANTAYTNCIVAKEAELAKKWNLSRLSLSVATGKVRADEGRSTSLGTAFAGSLIYGFDHLGSKMLEEGAAISVTWKHTRNEPVLTELAKGSVVKTNTTLIAARISGGTSKVRGLIEASDVRGTQKAVPSQTVFKHAVGIDVRLSEGTWLALRAGKQRKKNGDGVESASLLDFSFSPKSNIL